MLNSGWQQEFSKLAESSISLFSELAETAYKQGSIVRLKSCVEFLLKHNSCDDPHLVHLAEAGLKTQRPMLVEFALQQLLKRNPQQADYVLHLASAQSSLQKHSEALETLAKMPLQCHAAPEFVQQRSAIQAKLKEQQELFGLVDDVLLGQVGRQLSDQDYEQHGQSILQAALNIGDKQAVIKITAALAKRLPLQQELLIELCQTFESPDDDSLMTQFVLAMAKVGSFPHLIRYYLEWTLNRSKPVSEPQQLLTSLKPELNNRYAYDVLAILYAVLGDWKSFGAIVNEAIGLLTKPPVLFKYVLIYWLGKKQTDSVFTLLASPESFTAIELCFCASALETRAEHQALRLELLKMAHNKAAENSRVLNDLGDALLKAGFSDEAIQSFYQAINKDPEEKFYTCFNLAVTLLEAGDSRQAFDYFKRAIAIDPNQWPTWQHLCRLMVGSGSWIMAYDLARYYLSQNSDAGTVWNALANAALKMNKIAESRDYVDQALRLMPGESMPLTTLGLIEMACGNITEAFAANHQILMSSKIAEPARRAGLSNMLFCGNYDPNKSAEQLFNIYRAVTGLMPTQKYFPKVNDYSGRRIRIGYVSADFKTHPVAFFIEALFKCHDRSKFEIFAYSGVGVEDSYSDMFREHVDHWKYVGKTSNEDLAEMIREDGIDLLMDLSGHTDGSRIVMFALKPCAVQVSWLGFAHTTGMRQMDYFLGDPQLTPESCDQYFSEQPYRLARASYCFTPNMKFRDFEPKIVKRADDQPLVLGNLGRAIRFNTPVLNLWKQVLDRVPNSIIKIDNPNFADDESQQMMRDRFEQHGIPLDRLWVGYTRDYWQSIVDIDIALDGFPQNSGTTLFEFLWCGTPVVSLKDRPSVGRLGAMVLHGVGRDEWIADTPEQYVDIIAKLASDRDELHRIRSGLRQEFLDSELCDGPGFTKAVEDAYVAMLEEKAQSCQ